jgi:hypothetical protein
MLTAKQLQTVKLSDSHFVIGLVPVCWLILAIFAENGIFSSFEFTIAHVQAS